MPPAYTVHYFAIHGRAESIRVLLTLAGQAWEDAPITPDRWMQAKATFPLGQVPVLVEREGGAERQLPQSQAILRHLARKHGLYGSSEADMLRHDTVVETALDVRGPIAPLLAPGVRGKDPAALKAALEERVRPQLARLAKLVGEGPGPFVAGATPGLGDVVVLDLLDALWAIRPAEVEAQPRLAALRAAMHTHPALAAYLAGRRPSELSPLRQVLETGVPL